MAAVPDGDEADEFERFHTRGVERTEAFSDGVYAIALTLLVLNFDVPHLHGDTDKVDARAVGVHAGPSGGTCSATP